MNPLYCVGKTMKKFLYLSATKNIRQESKFRVSGKADHTNEKPLMQKHRTENGIGTLIYKKIIIIFLM